MIDRPYELLVRFSQDGSVAGAHVRTISTVNGRDYESDPTPLHGAKDSTFIAFAEMFSASVIAERDDLLLELAGLKKGLAELQGIANVSDTKIADRDTTIASLQAQIDALLNPPVNSRHLAPRIFFGLFTDAEIYNIETTNDPRVVVGRAELKTITTYVDLDLPRTVELVQYLETAGLIDHGRATVILSGEAR